MRHFLTLAVAMIGSAATVASAQDVNCANPSTQLELNVCSFREWQAADDELNRLWRIVKPSADRAGTGQALLEAQRAWLAYRDATCEAEAAQYAGGSIVPLVRNSCATRLTLARNVDLRAMQ